MKLQALKDYAVLTLASVIFAFAWEGFMIPNGMSSGGLMGLCTVIQFATGGALQASYMYIGLNAVLIIAAILLFGLGFGFRTIYCIGATTIFLEIIGRMTFLHCVPGEFFFVEQKVLIPIIAGVLEATGIGLILKHGGSTGGTDIIALMVNKYWPIPLSRVFLVTDFSVICLLLLLPDKSFGDLCYGFEMMVTFSLMIDVVLSGQKDSVQLHVFSEKYEQIADHIIKELNRGVTVLHACGWYTKKEKDVLLVIISSKQLPQLSKAIKEIDPRAFMSVTKTSSVYGEGFEEIKAGLSRKKHNGDN